MSFKKICYYLLFLLLFQWSVSCNNDDDASLVEVVDESETDDDDPDTEEENENENENEDPDSESPVEFLNSELVYDGYVLINDAAANSVYLMNKEAALLYEWPLNDQRLGNDAFLLDSGLLLANLEVDDSTIGFGGVGGKLALLDKDGIAEWEFVYSSDDYILHHDAVALPNGNIISIVWDRKTAEEAGLAGYSMEMEVFPERIIEVNPNTDEIVWEWHSWDHLIQDNDMSKDNFGVVADNPQLIDLNFNSREDGDIMHANGINYDEVNDVVYLSVNFYHEVWVIDHSTSSEEAATSSGGNYGKGGDLIYRFGNPMAYDNPVGERLFYNNHFPNLLSGEDEGKMLIFTNGNGFEQSTVYEFELPANLSLAPNTDNEPKVIWSFTDPDLYSEKVSGAVKLPNNNVLITEGDFGVWEVTQAGEVVWKYSTPGFYWRAYHYEKEAPEILSLDLNPIP
ncbi:aryl-sulfate sulfotransferase [Muriicola sp. Z0-33]|uniref:aryl-sulfate sulfotransferase n=1 Tax=Muriicola sp. Z0-33 TaxID=2816957 RepID=UPI0022379D67|nr:aryl-sulfate sulfotransferase [Muriicola sp. Z0-33]MCW5516778.1 aryl-sulfate sulfotransferase [Muriicola sp. Z0-33]